jgi:hypothetical protein
VENNAIIIQPVGAVGIAIRRQKSAWRLQGVNFIHDTLGDRSFVSSHFCLSKRWLVFSDQGTKALIARVSVDGTPASQ